MRALVALARTSHFTLAAWSLRVTQSALSGLIKELHRKDRSRWWPAFPYSARCWTTPTVRSRTLPTIQAKEGSSRRSRRALKSLYRICRKQSSCPTTPSRSTSRWTDSTAMTASGCSATVR
ncbi:MAG: LysR family transcriptional regulator [Massilia sp.]